MHIEIPPESERLVKARAEAAGFDNIQDYVLNLILEDDAEQFDRARLERLAIEGLESGDAGLMTKQAWANIRSEVAARIEKEH